MPLFIFESIIHFYFGCVSYFIVWVNRLNVSILISDTSCHIIRNSTQSKNYIYSLVFSPNISTSSSVKFRWLLVRPFLLGPIFVYATNFILMCHTCDLRRNSKCWIFSRWFVIQRVKFHRRDAFRELTHQHTTWTWCKIYAWVSTTFFLV